ncbi:phosphopantetheine-binding protein [Shouchella sp. 1P09AA]|uniref:phosphopantetheine-binding protein n=1 Tax=unclassified Shouchella TaxID=2893065 RepID=UPI0039A3E199
MTYKEAVETIHFILKNELHVHTLHLFHEQARLNEDLAVDSVMILHLLVQLETEYGIAIPDEQLDRDTFYNVESLARFIEGKHQSTPAYD